MKSYNLGAVIATRELTRVDGGKVVVEIGSPQQEPDSSRFFCPYRITGMGKTRLSHADSGINSVAALQFVLLKIRHRYLRLQ